MKENDPLRQLLGNADEIDRERLAKSLVGYINIDEKSGRIAYKPKFDDLTSKEKVLVFLLSKKVAFMLGKIEKEEVGTKDIVDQTGIPKGTVAPKLKELKEGRFISQNDQSKYYVASFQIQRSIDEILKNQD